jgi:CRP-like cAMP-binding protein
MSKATFDSYFATYPTRSYKKRMPLITAGDRLEKIFYLKKGYVRLYSVSPDGQELTLLIYKPGDFFPIYVALKPATPYRYWAETLTDAVITTVPVESFVHFFKENPEVIMDLSERIMTRFDGSLRRMEYLAFGTALQRVASLIIILGEQYGKKTAEGIAIEAPFTHKDLANLTGITRETVSAIMSDLKKRGFIDDQNQQILIKSIEALTKESLTI